MLNKYLKNITGDSILGWVFLKLGIAVLGLVG